MTPTERALRIKVRDEILEAITKVEAKAEEDGVKTSPEFINGMRLAAAIAEERRKR